MTDYTLIALESNLCDLKIVREHLQGVMREESDFIISCLETGLIVMEETKPAQKQSFMSKLGASIKAFFEKIKGLFRGKAVEQAKKHTVWLKENEEHLKQIAGKTTIEVLPYWNGNYKDQMRVIKATVDNAVRNIQNKRFSHDYATKIIDTKHVTDKNAVEYLKNYYRTGERNQLKISQEKISGNALVKKVEEMLIYTLNYVGASVPAVNQTSDYIVKAIEKIDGKSNVKATSKPTGFNISTESYLHIENCLVKESDLVTCMNYSKLLEADETKPEEKKKTEVTNSEGKETAPTKVNVVSKDDESKDGDTKTEERSEDETKFVNEVISFIKLLFSAYTTVMEERFITYTNILRAIGNSKSMEIKGDNEEESSNKQTSKEEEEKQEGLVDGDWKNKPKEKKGLFGKRKKGKKIREKLKVKD